MKNGHAPEEEGSEKLITSYLSFRGLQRQHIDSFNHFIQHRLKQIVTSTQNKRITCESSPSFYLEYLDVHVDFPTHETNYDRETRKSYLYPQECRLSDLTYAADINVDINIFLNGVEQTLRGIKIGRMPIMLGSARCNLNGKTEKEIINLGECAYDPKGYFIVKGVEKVLLIQEQMVDNRIIVDMNSKTNQLETLVTSYHIDTKSKCSILVKRMKYYIKSSSFKDVSIFIFFKALGVESEQEIMQLIGGESYIQDELLLSLEDVENENIKTQQDALEYLGKQLSMPRRSNKITAAQQARETLNTVFLAHINCKRYDFYPRAVYLGLMIRRLIETQRDNSLIDNRDYYGNKRMKCAGQLMELQFEDKFKNLNLAIGNYLKKELGKAKGSKMVIKDVINELTQNRDIITQGLSQAIQSGNWKLNRFKMDRKGVSQLVSRISYISALGHLTKMSSQFEKTRKISGPRALLGSHWGMICPSDTPDGESCGLVKTLAIMTHITNDIEDEGLQRIIYSLGVEDLGHFVPNEYYGPKSYLVFLNGNIIGLHCNPTQLVNNLRLLRRRGKLNEFVSVFNDTKRKSVFISSDGGRLVRPLILVQDGVPLLTKQDINNLKINNAELEFGNFVKRGLIEYVDVNEQDNALIALTRADICKDTTHLEIDQMTILSCVTSIIPFPHHNQSPRNTYQCQMGKQSLGIIATNQLVRADTVLYLLIYPQTPLVRTVAMEAINYHKMPAGHNAQVAVMSYSCYDIEDALIMNKSSLDRGFGRTGVYKRYETECTVHQRTSGISDLIVPPVQELQGKKKIVDSRNQALDNDGLSKVGAKLSKGDIYVNKITPQIPNQAYLTAKQRMEQNVTEVQTAIKSWSDTPSVFKDHWSYNVDRVIVTRNESDTKIIKTVLRQIRRPELGDKFSSRHGQKGVVGLIVNQEDMPFSENGWCPDLIMNPHGYPSRMTVGKLLELVCGKLGSLEGNFKYGTAFAGEKVDEISQGLLSRGFHFQGKDCLISGITGEYMECYVYQGPIFYQRLRHMVADKIHARSTGPYQTLTRQPVEGRARNGGQRVGEMERDCLVAYGASNLLVERLLISSDLFYIWVCEECGLFKSGPNCEGCRTSNVFKVRLPYACKVMMQELLSLNIKPKLTLIPVQERQEYTQK